MGNVNGYRHTNVLLDAKTHSELREASYRLGKPVSVLVRKGISLVLKDCGNKKTIDN